MIPPNINSYFARLIVDELIRRGIDTFCICPGSRSTPLTLAAADHPDADIHIIHDERAAAFFAVGFARAVGRAAAVITTSGTAVANLFPAVVEAFHARIPLVTLTADRPGELQDCGAHQTINQELIFGEYAPESITIPAPGDDSDPYTVLDALSYALNSGRAAPIQINCRFREPLAPVEESYDYKLLSRRAERWHQDHPNGPPVKDITDFGPALDDMANIVTGASRRLLVAGPEVPWRASGSIRRLSAAMAAPICADILSACRGDPGGHIMTHFDLYLDSSYAATSLSPEVVIHIGGLPVSGRLQQFLRDNTGCGYIKIQDHDRTNDPDRLETLRIRGEIDTLIDGLVSRVNKRADNRYLERWKKAEEVCSGVLGEYFEGGKLTESSAAYFLGGLLSNRDALYLGNSMPVRDAESFAGDLPGVVVGCNRGVSGIDGTVSSACGFAAGSGRPTTVVSGDLALLHDLNSLAVASQSEVPVIIIVVNNDGGGIFHFLPIARYETHFEKYFAAPHGLRFENAAALFDLPYFQPGSISDFRDAHRRARNGDRSALIELVSDRRENAREHNAIRSRVHHLLSKSGTAGR